MPETMRPSQEAMLSPWFVARIDFSSHSEFVLCGYVYGHPRLEDGHMITTSSLLELSADDCWARTRNTLYWLRDLAGPGEDDRDFQLRLVLAADSYLRAPITLRGIKLHVKWPHPRSPASKFTRSTLN
jgi:hypothetical protein